MYRPYVAFRLSETKKSHNKYKLQQLENIFMKEHDERFNILKKNQPML